MAKPLAIVTRRWPAALEARLADAFAVRLNADDHPFSAEELRAALNEADALCATVTDDLSAEVLSAGGRTRIIANFGVGINHIDMDAARAKGIAVTNTPDVLTECTADLAMALLLMSARRAGEGERELRAGKWSGWRPIHLTSTRVWGKTLGIVGMGRIGIATARRAHRGFGMRILCFNRSRVPKAVLGDLAAEQEDSLDELLPQVDFLSLHCPANPESHHLIDAASLARMRPSAHLVNTARGSVVDEAALAEALGLGVIAGAGLDVYEAEPKVHPGLLALDNVVLLPHLGSGTDATREAMGLRVLDNLKAFFAGKSPPDLCN
ncbi:MAG: D-glycerate dehydrogenase [Gammaproteobacteria bacterium]|nr:D-glycerate dehydrogenase [Gammaproteobacteria bacterium]